MLKKEIEIAVKEMVFLDIEELVPFQGDLKTLTEDRYHALRKEILERKFSYAFHAWANAPDEKRYVADGHQRLRVLSRMRSDGWIVPPVPVVLVTAIDEQEFRLKVLAAIAQYGEVDRQGLYEFAELGHIPMDTLAEYPLPNLDMDTFRAEFYDDLTGSSSSGGDAPPERPTLADRFLVPPFSVLDARQGYWQDRKRQWLALGIQSELGRSGKLTLTSKEVTSDGLNYYRNRDGKTPEELDAEARKTASRLTPGGGGRAETTAYKSFGSQQHVDGVLMKSDSGNDPQYYFKKQEAEKRLGRELTTEEFQRDHYEGPTSYESGTSIFDPVLCEIAYRWFSPKSGHVLDPFAGGSVRGIIASHCGLVYTGIELRGEQVQANEQQKHLAKVPLPAWRQGDSREVLRAYSEPFADLVFACPPYADLEVYSDDPSDLSNMPWEQFLESYRAIIADCVRVMRNDRFAVWVIGDVRDKTTGTFRNLVGETVRAFTDAGAALYNDAVLVTMLGSLPIRAGRAFSGTRVMGKTHQNVLVFLKGDRRAATEACGEVLVPEISLPEDVAPPTTT